MELDLPDIPRWVEAHGIAADPASWRRELGAAYAVGSDRAKLIVICEQRAEHAADVVGPAVELLRAYPDHATLVIPPWLGDELRSVRAVDRAILHTLPDPETLSVMEGAVILDDSAPLDHLRPEVQEELLQARGHSTVWCVWVDNLPVAFAHAPWRSRTLFDLSVDVDPSVRQLGLGALVASAAIRAEREQGREPVWGADEDNIASQRLAHRLGFVAMDTLFVLEPVET